MCKEKTKERHTPYASKKSNNNFTRSFPCKKTSLSSYIYILYCKEGAFWSIGLTREEFINWRGPFTKYLPVPLGHTSPTVKHTPATESKVHNGEGPYLHPDLRFSRSLHHGEARLGHESKVHYSEGPYSHSDFRFSSFFWGPLPPENHTFRHPKFIHKRFA